MLKELERELKRCPDDSGIRITREEAGNIIVQLREANDLRARLKSLEEKYRLVNALKSTVV